MNADGRVEGSFAARIAGHVRSRALALGVASVLAILARCSAPAPPARTVEGVAAMLGDAVGGTVRPDDFVWEERDGFLTEAFLGRKVLFLAAPRGSTMRDLYRARVRLTRAGRPVAVTSTHDLTNTPDGDDRDLVAEGKTAVFTTFARGGVQGVTVLDLEGEGATRAARTWTERLGASITSWLDTGATRGIGRTEIAFALAPSDAKIAVEGSDVVMALGEAGEPAALSLRDGALNTGAHNAFQARARPLVVPARPLVDVLVAIANAELGARAARSVRSASMRASRAFARAPRADDTPKGVASSDAWPPPLEGSAGWAPIRDPLADSTVEPVPLFFEAVVHPDGQSRPFVRLIALDLRRLDLDAVAGFAYPPPTTGPRGAGEVAESSRARVVAAFSVAPSSPDAFDRLEGARDLGLVAEGRALVPPKPGAPTIAFERLGGVRFGALPPSALDADVRSLLQTPGPPFELDGAAVIARSAIGFLAGGHAIYAWTPAGDAALLSRALRLADVVYALPLASAPARTGFVLVAAPEHPIDPAMTFSLEGRSPESFIFATVRDPAPTSKLGWSIDAGKQPDPAFVPAIYDATIAELGAQVHVTLVSAGRCAFKIRAGTKEPATKAALLLPNTLSDADAAELLLSIGLGTGRKKNARGIRIEGATAFKFHEDMGVLAVTDGKVRVLTSADAEANDARDATELPLTADDGRLRPEAREVGSMRARSALCVLPDGSVLVASTTFDSDESTTQALLDAGCGRVVALDRGQHQAAFVARAGDPGLNAHPEDSVLDAIASKMPGRARSY